MKYAIGAVDYADTVHLWVLDLPGCITGGPTFDAAAAMLPVVIAEYEGWLRSHGERLAPGEGWEIAERLDGRAFDATGGEFCFEDDCEPLGREELERGITLMNYARADLLAALSPLPDAVLDWAPPRSTVAHFDAWAPEVRTIRDIERHVMQLEAYYRDGLRDGPSSGIFGDVTDPTAERGQTVTQLRALSDHDLSRTWRPVRPGRTAAEEWTVRKIFRRTISHERVHTAEVAQRRSWVLLGIPRESSNDA
jgi:hypothetical protein